MADDPDGEPVKGEIQEVAVEGPCPDCGRSTLVMRSLALDLPYFGEALQTTVLCRGCAFRHADLLLVREGQPVRYELDVRGAADLDARVVRSSSGTIRIPEVGVRVEPGPAADAFVSNAEGVLRRVRDIVSFATRAADSDATRERGEKRLAKIDAMIEGSRRFTLIVEDPMGNSAILHPRAVKRALRPEQARRLKMGKPTFRVSR